MARLNERPTNKYSTVRILNVQLEMELVIPQMPYGRELDHVNNFCQKLKTHFRLRRRRHAER